MSPGLEGEAQGSPRRDLGAPCAVRRGQAEGDQSGPLRADSPAQGPRSFECTVTQHTGTHTHTHTHSLSLCFLIKRFMRDFPGGPVAKNLPCNAGD